MFTVNFYRRKNSIHIYGQLHFNTFEDAKAAAFEGTKKGKKERYYKILNLPNEPGIYITDDYKVLANF